MRTLRQFSYLGTATLLTATLGVLSGCATSVGGDGTGAAPGVGSDTGAGGGGNTGAGGFAPGAGGEIAGVGGGGAVPGTGGGGGEVLPQGDCMPGIPATSQITRLKNRQYDNVMRDLLGVTTLSTGEIPSSRLSSEEGAVNRYIWNGYYGTAEIIAADVMGGANREKFISCDPAAAGCLRDTIIAFGRKAFRRPLTEDEIARFEKLGQTEPAGTPEEVAETTLLAFLVSPSFIQVNEVNDTAATDASVAGAFSLSPYEIAMRLSLTLWGSIPDDILNAAADAGELSTPEQIVAQAERMVQVRDKSALQVVALHEHYAKIDDDQSHWWKMEQDPAVFPNYSPEAVPVMQQEMKLFFEDVAFSGGSFADLLLSNVAFVNEKTAALYGLAAADYGPELTRVELDPTQRPGYLTRLGFLSSHSHYRETSPILRGAFLVKELFGAALGPPADGADEVVAPDREYKTQAEYVTALTEGRDCKGCHHVTINPPGFVFESFDATGAWQTVDALGGPIVASAELYIDEANPVTVSSPREMMEQVVDLPSAKRLYLERLVSAATGRFPNAYDACTVDVLEQELNGGEQILGTVAGITQAESFRLRTRAAN